MTAAPEFESSETGRCDVCRDLNNLDRIPLGTLGEGVDVEAVDATICERCFDRLSDFFGGGDS